MASAIVIAACQSAGCQALMGSFTYMPLHLVQMTGRQVTHKTVMQPGLGMPAAGACCAPHQLVRAAWAGGPHPDLPLPEPASPA